MVRLNTQGMSKKDLDAGFDRPQPGTYHVAVNYAVENEDDQFVDVTFTVLAGKPEGQQGKEHKERFFYGGEDEKKVARAIKRLSRLAFVLGLITEDDMGKELNVDFAATADGRQCVIKLDEREYEKDGQKKTAMNIGLYGFGMWNVDDKEVAAVPKDEAMAKMAVNTPAGPVGVAAGAPAGGNDYSDI